MITRVLQWSPRTVLIYAAILTTVIAVTDWRVEFNATLGFLYMFPIVLLGTVLNWWQLVIAAVICTGLSDRLDPFPMDMEIPRDILIFLTLTTTGFLSLNGTRSYRRETESAAARRTAEEQLAFLIESSPAAILTMSAQGEILLANPAAHRLLRVPGNLLPGKNISRYVPALASIPSAHETSKIFRTEMQTRGRKETGEVFLADVFFSTYVTPVGPRLAALLVDASEELREREEANLQQLLASSRILVAAVSHEVRNVCGAIGMMHENLVRSGTLHGNQDFERGDLAERFDQRAQRFEILIAVQSSAADQVFMHHPNGSADVAHFVRNGGDEDSGTGQKLLKICFFTLAKFFRRVDQERGEPRPHRRDVSGEENVGQENFPRLFAPARLHFGTEYFGRLVRRWDRCERRNIARNVFSRQKIPGNSQQPVGGRIRQQNLALRAHGEYSRRAAFDEKR